MVVPLELLGREAECTAVDRLLADARGGRSGVVVLVGEPGIGKSALLEYARGRADEMRVLSARGVESEAEVPFGGLLELVRPALGLLDRIPEPQASALAAALALRPGDARERFAVGAATLSLLAAYAEEAPLALLVDDVQWLDGSSAEALLFAVRRFVVDPVATIMAAREGEPSPLLAAGLPVLRVEGLARAAAADLLARAAHEPVPSEVADRLYRATGGNPLALLELGPEAPRLAGHAEAPVAVSTTIARAFLRRAKALPERTRQVLVLAAASDGGDVGLVARAGQSLGLEVDDLAAAERAGLIRLREGSVEFRHPLTRSAIYAEAAAEDRRAAHRALAATLPDRDADRRAWHLALGTVGPNDAASSALEQAGVRAFERSAYAVAAAMFERAAALAVDDARAAPLLYAAGDAAWLGGRADRAVELLDRARAHGHDASLAVKIEHLRGRIAARRGPVEQAQAILAAAAEQEADSDPERAVVMLAEATNASFYAGDPRRALRTGERAAELARRTDGRAAIFAGLAHGMALVFAGAGEAGARSIRQAVERLEASDELRDDPHLLVWAALGPLWLREAEAGRSLYERALALVRKRTALGALPELLVHVARDWATTDRWADAHAAYAEGIELARESGQDVARGFGLAGLAWLEARQGREEDCRAHAAEGREICVGAGVVVHELWTLAALAELELGLGRPDAAVAHLEEWDALLREREIEDADLSPAPELVETYLRLGRAGDAVAAAARHDELARAKGQPWALARAARAHGLVAPDDELEPYFGEALRLHAQTPDAFEAARTRLAYGARLRRARQRVRAREELRAALEAFDRLGAAPWAETARTELAATGETARRRDDASRDQLTPQELQIASLAADGNTTREIAAALFLSPKTIEYHLRHVYRKLGIASRDALGTALRKPVT